MPALPRLRRQQLQRRLSAELARAADILDRWASRVAPSAPSVAPGSPAGGAAAPTGAPAHWLDLVRTHAPELLEGGGIRVGTGDEGRSATTDRTPTVAPRRDPPGTDAARTGSDARPQPGPDRSVVDARRPGDGAERAEPTVGHPDQPSPRSAGTFPPTSAHDDRHGAWMPMPPAASARDDGVGAGPDDPVGAHARSMATPPALEPEPAGPHSGTAVRRGIFDRVLDRVAPRRAASMPGADPGPTAPATLDGRHPPRAPDRGIAQTSARTGSAHREPVVPPPTAREARWPADPSAPSRSAASDGPIDAAIDPSIDRDVALGTDRALDVDEIAGPAPAGSGLAREPFVDRPDITFTERAVTSPRWPALPGGPNGRSDTFDAERSTSEPWDPWPALPDDLGWFEPVGSVASAEHSTDGRSALGTPAGLWDHVADLDAEQRGH